MRHFEAEKFNPKEDKMLENSNKLFRYDITKTDVDHMTGTRTIHYTDFIHYGKLKDKDIFG
jgi:hypothetical protein